MPEEFGLPWTAEELLVLTGRQPEALAAALAAARNDEREWARRATALAQHVEDKALARRILGGRG